MSAVPDDRELLWIDPTDLNGLIAALPHLRDLDPAEVTA